MGSTAFTLCSLARSATTSLFPKASHLPQNPIKELPLVTVSVTREEKDKVRDHENTRALLAGRRGIISACSLAALSGLSLWGSSAFAAILEADDDEELLERVKKDRLKRLERQGVISSSKKETGYLQELVYKLSKVGQAIEKGDFSTAVSVLGQSTDTDWFKNVNVAFSKLSSNPEEKTEVDAFNSSIASLISSVSKRDLESSQQAFVSSASSLEKWAGLTGLTAQLRGL